MAQNMVRLRTSINWILKISHWFGHLPEILGTEAWWDPARACPTKPICLRHQRMFNELNVALSCPMSTWEAGGCAKPMGTNDG